MSEKRHNITYLKPPVDQHWMGQQNPALSNRQVTPARNASRYSKKARVIPLIPEIWVPLPVEDEGILDWMTNYFGENAADIYRRCLSLYAPLALAESHGVKFFRARKNTYAEIIVNADSRQSIDYGSTVSRKRVRLDRQDHRYAYTQLVNVLDTTDGKVILREALRVIYHYIAGCEVLGDKFYYQHKSTFRPFYLDPCNTASWRFDGASLYSLWE